MDGQRTLNMGPWHYCQRCDEKTKIASLTWQKNLLLCETCVDKNKIIPGDREIGIAEVLSDGKIELTIDPKLSNPETFDFDDLDIYR
jgi:hypothetical protein